ncbi:hypothetical protein RUM43_000382, partial [Polyplax serrata]
FTLNFRLIGELQSLVGGVTLARAFKTTTSTVFTQSAFSSIYMSAVGWRLVTRLVEAVVKRYLIVVVGLEFFIITYNT